MESKTQRNSAIELLRIVSMFFIIMRHYSTQTDWGGWTTADYSFNVLFLQLITIGGSTANNIFLLISGYHMIRSGVRVKNVLRLLAEMIRKSEMIIFNRCDTVRDSLNSYKRNIKAVNPNADVIFEGANGEIDEILEEDLPYDLSKEELVLDNNGYGIWYLDCMDHLERYLGKKIRFTAMVLKPDDFPKGYFVPGRMAMTCCAEDMAFLGYACEFPGAAALKQRDWVEVTATVSKEYWEDYKGEGPILHALSVLKTKAPKEEVISFT